MQNWLFINKIIHMSMDNIISNTMSNVVQIGAGNQRGSQRCDLVDVF